MNNNLKSIQSITLIYENCETLKIQPEYVHLNNDLLNFIDYFHLTIRDYNDRKIYFTTNKKQANLNVFGLNKLIKSFYMIVNYDLLNNPNLVKQIVQESHLYINESSSIDKQSDYIKQLLKRADITHIDVEYLVKDIENTKQNNLIEHYMIKVNQDFEDNLYNPNAFNVLYQDKLLFGTFSKKQLKKYQNYLNNTNQHQRVKALYKLHNVKPTHNLNIDDFNLEHKFYEILNIMFD